jgi:hypothetical protein
MALGRFVHRAQQGLHLFRTDAVRGHQLANDRVGEHFVD